MPKHTFKHAPIVGAGRLARLIAVFLWIDGLARAGDAVRIHRAYLNGIDVPDHTFNVYLNIILGLIFFGIGVLLYLEAPMFEALQVERKPGVQPQRRREVPGQQDEPGPE